ncbi:hypothetical protein DFH08DRAFT_971357 [Mycena albidolilacea]|uniref:Uncharacterized protein n=1 Tax=Mycena albidolilacea TaxID=1033008 RepID=A0AAD6ZE27_9AGAR|nr:hypothetical protein DFH08DRAFT_971357 [Mycena albidolilacea]
MPKAMVDSLLAISESVAATRYPDRVKQRAFLDEKTVALEGFSTMIPAIARDKSLYDTERELNRVGLSASTIAAQQAHRTELEDARVAAEEQAAAEAAATVKPKKSKGKKSKKSKAIVEDIDDDVSVFDDSEFPMTGSEALAQCILAIDELRASFSNMQVEEGTPSTSHRTTQSLDAHASAFPVTPTPSTRPSSVRLSFLRMKGFDRSAPSYIKAMAILSRTDPESASGPVTADFPVPPRKSVSVHIPMPTRTPQINTLPQSLLLMDLHLTPFHRFTPAPKSEIRSRIGFSNAQLRYLLEHREYLLKDLSRILMRNTSAPSRIDLGRMIVGPGGGGLWF